MDTTLPSRNPDFVGQEAFLRDLEQKRQLGNRIALVGLGGIGYYYFNDLIMTREL